MLQSETFRIKLNNSSEETHRNKTVDKISENRRLHGGTLLTAIIIELEAKMKPASFERDSFLERKGKRYYKYIQCIIKSCEWETINNQNLKFEVSSLWEIPSFVEYHHLYHYDHKNTVQPLVYWIYNTI